jgi:hypothetical protein
VILMAGCTRPHAYRYTNRVLIPPGVRKAEVSARMVSLPLAVTCRADSGAVMIEPSRREARVTVKPAELRAEPAGWLENWAESLEQRGCIPIGDGHILAAQLAEIVPLERGVAFSLLHPPERDYVDLNAGSRLKAVGPLFRAGAKPETRAIESVASVAGTLTVTASPDLVGVETAWYAVEPYPNRPGARIVFLSAEDRTGDLITLSSIIFVLRRKWRFTGFSRSRGFPNRIMTRWCWPPRVCRNSNKRPSAWKRTLPTVLFSQSRALASRFLTMPHSPGRS